MSGYHKLKLMKHSNSSLWKIEEEMLEYIDAISTNNKVMAIQELSDLFGVIEDQANKMGITIEELKTMSDLTKSVFQSGSRESSSLYSIIKKSYILLGKEDGIIFALMPNNFIYLFTKHATSDDTLNESLNTDIIIELIKGSCDLRKNSVKESMSLEKLVYLSSKDIVEINTSNDTIVKIKYFDSAINTSMSLDEDSLESVLAEIKSICES